MIKGTAPMRLKLEFNGTTAQFVELVDTIARESDGVGLDSYDAGDAMGWCITECMLGTGELPTIMRGDLTLSAWIEYDNFEWEGLTDEILVRPPLTR